MRTMSFLSVLLLTSACQPAPTSDTGGADTGSPPVDADGDGVPAGEDCDDGDDAVFPGAPEVCNGQDDDCDGVVDDDPTDGFTAWLDDDRDGYGAPDTGRSVCTLTDGLADNDTDCDDTDDTRWIGVDGACALASCTEATGAGVHWILDGAGGAFEGWCSGDGWLRIAHLAAGERSSDSIDRTTRFFHHPWIQETDSYQTLTSNADVILDGSTYGMLDARDLLGRAEAIRWTCTDLTRSHTAEGQWLLDGDDWTRFLDTITYDDASTPITFVYDGASTTADVYLTLSYEGFAGPWHICGAGDPNQAANPDGWQLGFCYNGPGASDFGLQGVAQIAVGYHPGYPGIRLECGNDTPADSSTIDGDFAIWIR